MKLENTPENKERFNGLYTGQYVQRNHNWLPHTTVISIVNSEPVALRGYKVDTNLVSDGWYLELTPLSQISDEDAIEVARMNDGSNVVFGYRCLYHFGIRKFKDGQNIQFGMTPKPETIYLLRRRGYYVGDGTEIEYGWAKLKQ